MSLMPQLSRFMNWRALSLLSAFLLPLPAFATNQNVTGAQVNDGVTSVELRSGIDFGDGHTNRIIRERLHVDHSFSDAFNLRLSGSTAWPAHEGRDYKNTGIDLKYQFVESEEDGYDFTARLDYRLADRDDPADKVQLLGLYQKRWDSLEFRHNTTLAHDVGGGGRSGLQLGTAWQITESVTPQLRGGVELFNSFGRLNDSVSYSDQQHRFGPVIKAAFDGGYHVQCGYLLGISDAAPNHAFKLFLMRNF